MSLKYLWIEQMISFYCLWPADLNWGVSTLGAHLATATQHIVFKFGHCQAEGQGRNWRVVRLEWGIIGEFHYAEELKTLAGNTVHLCQLLNSSHRRFAGHARAAQGAPSQPDSSLVPDGILLNVCWKLDSQTWEILFINNNRGGLFCASPKAVWHSTSAAGPKIPIVMSEV